MKVVELTLYMRLGCHLCHQVRQWLAVHDIAHQLCDIDRDAALKRQYDVLVPVLYRHDLDRELLYPFTETQLLEFVA